MKDHHLGKNGWSTCLRKITYLGNVRLRSSLMKSWLPFCTGFMSGICPGPCLCQVRFFLTVEETQDGSVPNTAATQLWRPLHYKKTSPWAPQGAKRKLGSSPTQQTQNLSHRPCQPTFTPPYLHPCSHNGGQASTPALAFLTQATLRRCSPSHNGGLILLVLHKELSPFCQDLSFPTPLSPPCSQCAMKMAGGTGMSCRPWY